MANEAVTALADLLNLPVERVRVALRCYAAHPHEIDAEVALAE